jgi:hypothetical protein
MAVKATFKKDTYTLDLTGEFDETSTLGTNVKGKLVNSTGDFVGLGWDEEDDILITNGSLPNTGAFGGSYNRYTQAYMSVTSRKGTGKDGNNYAYVMKRPPNIASSSTWGGVSLYPPSALQRQSNNRYRFSFDYRGYSGGYTMNQYQSYTIGWSNYGIGLPTPWSYNIGSFDTDWEWQNSNFEFTVTDNYLNVIAGNYDWDPNVQYGTGWYGIRYNGNLYRHRSGRPAPTLGVDPETEYLATGTATGPYDVRWVNGASPGYFNVYNNVKIGFTYQAQNARGTHVHVDNITITDITNNDTFKFDIASGLWITENASDSGLDVLIKGTAYVAQARTDTGTDIFAVEGNRYVKINDTVHLDSTGRGLALTVINSSGGLVSNTTYDVHGSGAACNSLATALASVSSSNYWILTSFDAIGNEAIHNSNPNLRNWLIAAGSDMWDPNNLNGAYLWSDVNQVRNPYAAIGKGTQLIKEDGSNAADSTYKRKGVIQVRV